jgi:5-methylcytosine-specific restriction endonuclease McrA
MTERSRRFRAANPGYHREWYQENIETERKRARQAQRVWRAANPAEERERKQRYRKANADVVRARELEKTHARRAMTQSSPELSRYMAQLLEKPCAYCNSTDNITIDHIVPLSRGGTHERANLAPACWSCNCSKGARLLEEWTGRLAYGVPVVP